MKSEVIGIILFLSTSIAHDDEIDPFDMLNFDHASMTMENKKVKKDNPTDEVKKKVEESTIDQKIKNDIPPPVKEPIPPDVKINIPHESLSKENPASLVERPFDLTKCPIKKSPASPLFRQFVKTLLNHISSKVLYDGEYDMRLQLTVEDIEILKRYGNSETEVDIYTAHTILTGMINSFREVTTGDKSGHRLWIEDQLGFSLENLVQMMIIVVLMAGICAMFIFLKFSVKQLFIVVFVFLFFTSWLLTWYTLCKKEISKQHYIISKNMPEYCKNRENQDTSFLSVTFSWLASPFRYEKDECLEYFEHLIIDPYIKVSPIEALAVTLTRFFVAPLSHIAEELSKALRMFLKDLPVHVAPIAVIGLFMFGVLILFMGFGYRVSSFFLTIGPGERNTARQIQALEDKYEKERNDNKALKLDLKAIRDLVQRIETTSVLPAISHISDQLPLQNGGDGSSHSFPNISKLPFKPKLETIPNEVSDSKVLVSTVNGFKISKKDSKNKVPVNNSGDLSGENIKVSVLNDNGDVSAVNGCGDVSSVNENGEVSSVNETGDLHPVQCSDNQLNRGIEEIHQKPPGISVIKNNTASST